jgi:hypothetical protein
MTIPSSTTGTIWVAIDVAKRVHQEDLFAAGRGGVTDGLVDNARTFRLDCDAV